MGGLLFGGFEVIFLLMFVLVLGIFGFTLARGIAQWHRNNRSPRLTVDASVVTKRTSTHHHHHDHHHSVSTRYHVTFEVESGDRFELTVGGADYGLLVEGDRGRLTFQGTRYLGFEREL